jgi:hypothetical protein
VRAAIADRSTSDSRRGLMKILSPTQIESNAPEASTCSDTSSNSSTLVTPKSTPRFARLIP